MEPVLRVQENASNSEEGVVSYDLPKMIWNLGMIALAICFAPSTFSFEALLLFLLSTYFSLLIGHSVGMHRMMIHRTFNCPKVVERTLIYIGVLVGMSGPYGIIKIHDLRDWAQRKDNCHDFFSHSQGYFKDLWWQLTSKFEFSNPPKVMIESKLADDLFIRFLEKSWRLHQLLLAVFLYYLGGWSFVVWGVFLRVAISNVGHWSITYFCHNPGPGKWRVKDAAVQASNIPGLGIVSYGECWHNNHHAFPESAKIGLEKGQSDPAWWFILLLSRLGLANNIRTPRKIDQRDDIYPVG